VTDELNRIDQIPDEPGDVRADAADRAETADPLGDQSAAVKPTTQPSIGPVADASMDVPAQPESAELPPDRGSVAPCEPQERESAVGDQELLSAVPSDAADTASAGKTPAEETAIDTERSIVAEQSPAMTKAGPETAVPVKAKPSSSSRRNVAEPELKEPKPKSSKMDWYILKVQSNREESIKEGLLRRVAIAGLDYYFGDVIVPTEKVTEFKAGKKRVRKRKLYPGYLVVQMEINDDTWFLVRETPGIGDFTGAAGRPSPMLPHEVSRILAKQEEKSEKAPKLNINFRPGDQVKINEGTFENFEGQVQSIDEQNGRVTVMINIFGRSTPVELEYWQIGAV